MKGLLEIKIIPGQLTVADEPCLLDKVLVRPTGRGAYQPSTIRGVIIAAALSCGELWNADRCMSRTDCYLINGRPC